MAPSLPSPALLIKTPGWLWPVVLHPSWSGGQEGRVDPLEISCLAVSHRYGALLAFHCLLSGERECAQKSSPISPRPDDNCLPCHKPGKVCTASGLTPPTDEARNRWKGSSLPLVGEDNEACEKEHPWVSHRRNAKGHSLWRPKA